MNDRKNKSLKIIDAASRDKFRMNGETLDGFCHVIDEGRKKTIKNDKGEVVPEICPECGSKVALMIQGEPIYRCSNDKCKKFFGGMPFPSSLKEEYCLSKRQLREAVDEFDGKVDLSSFRPQKELNPKIWLNGKINSEVRLRLLDIADDFIDNLNVSWAKPKDIILTGSLANYNWSTFSDFDLHILIDFNEVDKRTDFVKEYFDSKKKIWNDEHNDILIYGFPVELYVQDVNEKHTASGVYSLEKNEWVVEPEPDNIKAIMLNKFYIKEKVTQFCEKIDKLEELCNNEKDRYKLREIGRKAVSLFDKIRGLRRESLEKSGEMGSGNIIFKVLRRNEYLGKLSHIKSEIYDKLKSID